MIAPAKTIHWTDPSASIIQTSETTYVRLTPKPVWLDLNDDCNGTHTTTDLQAYLQRWNVEEPTVIAVFVGAVR